MAKSTQANRVRPITYVADVALQEACGRKNVVAGIIDPASGKLIGFHADLTGDIAVSEALKRAIRAWGAPEQLLMDHTYAEETELVCRAYGIVIVKRSPHQPEAAQ